MELIETLERRNKLVRRLIEGALLLVAAVYYGTLAIMHAVSPIWDMLPLLLFAFSLPLLAALATVHFIRRLNWMVTPLAVSLVLLALPLLIVMHNFQEGLANHSAGLFFFLPILGFLLSASFVFILALMIGIIGLGIIGYFKYYSGK